MSNHEHMINKIRKIDENIRHAEDRIAENQVWIGNWRREREALFRDLTPEEKGALLAEGKSEVTGQPSASTETQSSAETKSS